MVGNILRQRYESLEKRADSLQEGDGRRNTRLLVKTLQLLVGALVTVGGSAFTVFALNDFGKALGAIHLSIGLIGIVTGFVILWSKMLPRRFLLGVNFATIVYSSFSEGSFKFNHYFLPDHPPLLSSVQLLQSL